MSRRALRILIPVLFLVIVAVTALLTVTGGSRPGASSTPAPSASASFPPDRVPYTRPDVTGGPPTAPAQDRISSPGRLTSPADVANSLPSGVMSQTSSGAWLISRPVAIEGPVTVSLSGPGEIDLAPGAFLLVENGGSLTMTGLTIRAVAASSLTPPSPSAQRGFVAALTGGQLVMRGDNVYDLGGLSDYGYGISMEQPAKGSGVWSCAITGNYFGVYLSQANGVQIVGNTVSHSTVYGIDPHTNSSHVLIEDNQVIDSGVHAIVLAEGVTQSTVSGNTISGAGDHGIVLYQSADRNTVTGNTIGGVFDGIVVTDAAGNRVSGNRVTAIRFGLRVGGSSSTDNILQGNFVSGAMVGAYVYDDAAGTNVSNNTWYSDRQNVLVVGAKGTVVVPSPTP